jgi:hypothetical protein
MLAITFSPDTIQNSAGNKQSRQFAIMQDIAVVHTANFPLTAVEAMFGGRFSHSGFWPYSPTDFDPCDYYLWKTPEVRVCVNMRQFFVEFLALWYIVSNIDMCVAISHDKI